MNENLPKETCSNNQTSSNEIAVKKKDYSHIIDKT